MFEPGSKKPPNSGRRKGTQNKRTDLHKLLKRHKAMHPFEVLTLVMKGDEGAADKLGCTHKALTLRMRMDAARDLLAYLEAKPRPEPDAGREPQPVIFAIAAPPGASNTPPDLSKGRNKPKKKPKKLI